MRYALRLAGLTLIAALPVAAQQPGNPGAAPSATRPAGADWRREGREGRPPMDRGETAFAPEHLLARNGELQLTAQQITVLTGIRDAARKAGQAAMEQSRKHLDELRIALDAATPDTTAIRTHFLAANESMGQARLARILAGARAKAVLTEAQRTQVTEWRQQHERDGWGPRRGPGAEPDNPMRHPGR